MNFKGEYIDKSQNGFLFFLERIARSHPLLYLIARFIAEKLNIFESDYNGVSKIIFKNKINLLDIGASNGISIKFLKSKLDLGNIYAVEPNFDYCKSLKKIKNIKIYNYGLSNKNERKKVFIPEYTFIRKKIKLIPYTFYDKKLLKKILLKNFIFYKKFKIVEENLYLKKKIYIKNRIDLIKLDVNGYEYEIIKCLKNLISKHNPVLLVEELKKINKIDRYLSKLDYDCCFYSYDNDKIQKYNFKNDSIKPLTFYFIPKKNKKIKLA